MTQTVGSIHPCTLMTQTSCIIGTSRETGAATGFSVSHIMCRVSSTHCWAANNTMSSVPAAAAVLGLCLNCKMLEAHGETGAHLHPPAASKQLPHYDDFPLVLFNNCQSISDGKIRFKWLWCKPEINILHDVVSKRRQLLVILSPVGAKLEDLFIHSD